MYCVDDVIYIHSIKRGKTITINTNLKKDKPTEAD